MKYFLLIIVSFFSSFSVAENSVEGKWEGIASNASGGIDNTYLAVDKGLGELIISYNLHETEYCKFDMSSKREMRGVIQFDLLNSNGRPSKKPIIIELVSEL